MKVLLSIFAQDLCGGRRSDPFAVVAQIHQEQDKKPTVIGKTEVINNTPNPDWTKFFVLEFELGKPMHILVTIHDERNNKSMGAAIFEIGAVLGTKGSIAGKEVKGGGIIMAHVERCSGSGVLNLRMRGIQLKNTDGILSKSDPFFELQRKRKAVGGAGVVWDCIFRSLPVENNLNPLWNEAYIELSALCVGDLDCKFRVAIFDFDKGSKHDLIGSFEVSVNELLGSVTEGAMDAEPGTINTDKAFGVMKGVEEVGKVVTISASTSGIEEGESTAKNQEGESTDGEDIVLEATDDIVLAPDDLDGGANFVDYVSGGCQLRVVIAIDYTGSNGDPRKEESLHFFRKDGKHNDYETAISKLCNILSEYDSDHKYPVWGFGAKKDGQLNHCFQCGDEEEADGVDGVLKAYKDAFRSGLAMSKPTDITQVIKEAGTASRKYMDSAMKSGNQEYSILLIFTNGTVHDVTETVQALDDVESEPLSVVIIGVGPGNFSDMAFLDRRRASIGDGRNNCLFVEMKSLEKLGEDALTEATLKEIPGQLVSYFVGKGIQPNPPVDTDEIVIEPFNEDDEVQAAVTVSESGDVVVNSDAKPPTTQPLPPSTSSSSDEPINNTVTDIHPEDDNKFNEMKVKIGNMAKTTMSSQGKRLIARQKKTFGKMKIHYQKKFDKYVDAKIKSFMPKL